MSGGGIVEMSGEAEDIYRWTHQIERSLQNAVPHLERARKSCGNIRGLARGMKIEEALALKAKVESQIWIALGACIDPSASNDEKIELARRVFGRKEGGATAGAVVPTGYHDRERAQNLRYAREKVESLAHEVLKSRTLLAKSEDVLAALAERGWTSQKLAEVWDTYLKAAMGSGKLVHMEKGIKGFMDWLRSLEPKVVVEMGADLDTMSEEQLARQRDRLVSTLLDATKEAEHGS